MSIQQDTETFANACAAAKLGPDRAPPDRFPMKWMATAARAVAARIVAGARASWCRFLAALHEGRRRQAAIDRARYHHLIYDPDSGLFLGERGSRQKPPNE